MISGTLTSLFYETLCATCLRGQTRFRENVIPLIEEIVAFVDHLAKPFMAMFMAMAAVDIYCTILKI